MADNVQLVYYSDETKEFMRKLYSVLPERERRLYAAVEAMKLEYGGQKYISEILGCDPHTISAGIKELSEGANIPEGYSRIPNAGAKKIIDKIENIDEIFFDILKDKTAGSPMDEELYWTNLKLIEISNEFKTRGYDVSEHVVKQLLEKHGYVKRKMQKTKTVKETENRNEQFEKIDSLKKEYMENNNPIISMDVKKKEMLGNFYRDGKVYCTEAIEVNDHDFASFSEGTIIPHGIYDYIRNEGYVSIGTSKDTSEFSCDCLIDWWNSYGLEYYPNATSILVLADGGGSNSSRNYIFKEELEMCAITIGVEIRIAHYPPYTSKYNPIEHKLFCHIQKSFEGVVFRSYEIVSGLIKKTKTSTGLEVFCRVVNKVYRTGKKVAAGFKENMKIVFDDYLPEWNYRALPLPNGNNLRNV